MRGEDLLDLLGARCGIVCAVGAGGKKSVLQRLAALHPGPLAFTATVLTPPLPASLSVTQVVAEEPMLSERVRAAAARHPKVAYFAPSGKATRLGGVAPAVVAQIHREAGFALTLVKADGARMRWIKCPEEDEPRIPLGTATVIALVSARAIGEPLSERVAHRVDRIEAVSGAKRGEPLTPEQVARLMASEEGLMKGIGSARVVPVINMVDDPGREVLARQAAEAALALTRRFDRVLLCRLKAENPLVGVIARDRARGA
ncbi:selenium cofactor biosynthesis protein YqeC [Pelomicrobium sp.]|mgnify:CR=1 FL=1|uniref:selenium cofactor biosynthesis protein YqeC n=1 Tax=Pelomicrobium sp. TaxID=2815319 RepID=UPI002FDEB93D